MVRRSSRPSETDRRADRRNDQRRGPGHVAERITDGYRLRNPVGMHRHFRCARNILGLGRHENPVGPGRSRNLRSGLSIAVPLSRRSGSERSPDLPRSEPTRNGDSELSARRSRRSASAPARPNARRPVSCKEDEWCCQSRTVVEAMPENGIRSSARVAVRRSAAAKGLGIVIGIGSELYEIERHLGIAPPSAPKRRQAPACSAHSRRNRGSPRPDTTGSPGP